jgi:hypothetical protein
MSGLGGPLADDQTDNQTALRVDRCMVPTITRCLLIGRAVLLFLADVGPLLIELDLRRRRGKKPPTRCGVGGRGRQPCGYIGSPYPGEHPLVGRFFESRFPPLHGRVCSPFVQ